MILLYDGSFDGFLTAIYAGFYEKGEENILLYDEAQYQPNLIDPVKELTTDLTASQKVATAIGVKLSAEVFKMVVKAYLSENEESANLTFTFLKYAFKTSSRALEHESHYAVGPFVRMCQSVSRELHKWVGLMRFSELDNGIFYAQYESDHSLLLLLAPHFKERLGNQVWVIHDIGRQTAVFYDLKDWYIKPLQTINEYTHAPGEQLMQTLWKTYHEEIAIEERLNKKLQRQNMPKKYWKYLIEMSGKG